jgi:hypothetical protein
VGCSRKAEQLVGAGRLIRGPAGLGTTVRVATNPDRDTYVEAGTADLDSLLLLGTTGTFEARTFFKVAGWTLPDTTLPGFTPQTVLLELPRNLTLGFDSTTVNLSLASAPWDTTNVVWPGPSAGAHLGTGGDNRLTAVFSLPLDPGSFTEVVQWAHNPTSIPGFTLQAPPGQALAAYVAGALRFRISYTHTVSGAPVADTVNTRVTEDLYLHSPLSPAPSGADTALVLGGLFKTELAVHFPVDSIPAGASVDEATLVLNLLPSSSAPDLADAIAQVEVRAIRSGWSEGVTEQSGLPADSTQLTSGALTALYSTSTRSIAIRLPGALMREWVATPSTNGGVLVRLINRRNLTKVFLIGSRESSRPPEVHISYTQLPPGRF